MELTLTAKSVKEMAARLRIATPKENLTVAASQEMMAHLLGFKNWDTLSGQLKKPAKAEAKELLPIETPEFLNRAQFAKWRKTPPVVATPFTMVCDAFACDEWGDGPRFAKFEITQDFVNELHRFQTDSLVKGYDISLSYHVVTEWDNDDSLRIRDDDLYVSRDRFWVRARPKHADYAVETRMMDIEDLFKAIDVRGTKEIINPYTVWVNDVLFKDGSDAKSFAEELFNNGYLEEEGITEDHIEELMGD